jgi:hypothetical protein
VITRSRQVRSRSPHYMTSSRSFARHGVVADRLVVFCVLLCVSAAAIARQVNIFPDGAFTREELAQLHGVPVDQVPEDEVECIVVKGPDLDHYSEADWLRTLSKPNIVFARTTPQQKLQIVEHLQAMGNVVAATGDGGQSQPSAERICKVTRIAYFH